VCAKFEHPVDKKIFERKNINFTLLHPEPMFIFNTARHLQNSVNIS
jgi:hypothetical protein